MKEQDQISFNMGYALSFVWKCQPMYVVWEFGYGVLTGIWGAIGVIFIKLFYDSLVKRVPFSTIVILIVVMCLLTGSYYFWYHWYTSSYKPRKTEEIHYYACKVLFEKNKEIDLACYDDPTFYNKFVWSMNEFGTRIVGVIESLATLIQHVIAFIVSSGVMLAISPALAVVAVVSSVVYLIVQGKWIKLNMARKEALMPAERKCNYYESIYNTPNYAKEIRVTHVSDMLLNKYTDTLSEKKEIHTVYNIKILKFSISGNLLSGLMQPIVYMILFYQILVEKTVDITGLAVAFSSFWSLRYRLQFIVETFGKIQMHVRYMAGVRNYLTYSPTVKSGIEQVAEMQSIEFKNVSFAYKTGGNVLKNVNLTIQKGEKIALIGFNGAGKSTLLKLLLRLYDPTDGVILYNGKDIKEYDIESYRKKFGVVLQDSQLFALSIAENVLGDLYNDAMYQVVMASLYKSQFSERLSQMENGIQTELTRELSVTGTNLSGGELQKLAIARIFAKPSDVFVMDEPCAALDPDAEDKIMQNITEAVDRKALLMVSHRLSTVHNADRIYLFDNGEIREQGTHNELLQKGGIYTSLFKVQASKYNTAPAK